MDNLPIIDLGPLLLPRDSTDQNRLATAAAIGRACRDFGFFYIANHGIETTLQSRLEAVSREFFAAETASKLKISMTKGGKAWRGYFPVGNELTSGRPDLKEGIYFGSELPPSHPQVKAGLPLHGPNLFPENPPELRDVVLEYMDAMTKLGHTLMSGMALSLGLAENFFEQHYTRDPLILFRIFNYPPLPPEPSNAAWGVGEHTDYGVLTILKQDDCGGLEVRAKSGWLAAPPISETFVCNIGDMLDRMTGGLYRSTPHRVKNCSGRARLSFPFFFDPNFFAEVKLLPIVADAPVREDSHERWDRASVHGFEGTYGDYLLGKVGKVFPGLKQKVLD